MISQENAEETLQAQLIGSTSLLTAMLIALMETQVEMGDTDKANATLMSIVEENMNGTRPKNTAE